MWLFIGVFLAAFLVTFGLVPTVARLALLIGAVDNPNRRKVHEFPTPRLGGVAIYIGFLVAMGTAVILAALLNRHLNLNIFFGILFGGTILVLLGIIDDMRGLTPWVKFLFQFLAAAIAFGYGIRIEWLTNPFDSLITLGIFAIPITLLWVVGITNAVNLLDGLDGLAAGVTAIASATLFLVALRTHQVDAAIYMIALAGCALGFLRYNFNPASIFLGDSGSLFLGFILACSSVAGVLKSTILVALIIPILILGIPIYDTASVIIRRVSSRQPVFSADKRHLHHRLLKAGFTQRQAVLAIYGACVLLSLAALAFAWLSLQLALIISATLLVIFFIAIVRIKAYIRRSAEVAI